MSITILYRCRKCGNKIFTLVREVKNPHNQGWNYIYRCTGCDILYNLPDSEEERQKLMKARPIGFWEKVFWAIFIMTFSGTLLTFAIAIIWLIVRSRLI